MSDGPSVKTIYRIGGMDCASCVSKIETAVTRLPGVSDVGVSLASGTMKVSRAQNVPKGAIEQQVKALGYSIAPADERRTQSTGNDSGAHDHHEHDHFDIGSGPWWKTAKARLAAAMGISLAVAYGLHAAVPAPGSWLFLAALAVGLVPIARRAFAVAIRGTPFSIEMLMMIAAVGALFIGAAEEAAMVVFLFLVGELLEGVAASRARASIRGLTDLVPKAALVEQNGATVEIAADALEIGAIMIVRPGDRIAADGTIVAGESSINEAPVTGESVPKTKRPGDNVFAGTINADAVLRVRVTAAAADNTIARVVRLVEEAQESKAPTERFIDRFSRYYTPGVLIVGALVAVVPPLLLGQSWSEWLYKGLAILLIGCPCALVISTPAAIAAGLSAGARSGLLIKGGAVLETLRRVTLIAFDKTGTLTEGKPQLTDIVAVGSPEAKVLSLAAALESGSSHPLAFAVLARAAAERVPVPPAASVKAIGGKGVSGKVGGEEVLLLSPTAAAAQMPIDASLLDRIDIFNKEGKTVSMLIVAGAIAGILAIRDEARADAREALAALQAAGIKTVMLTGDNAVTARAIGAGLGIEVKAGLLPEDKQAIVLDFKRQGEIVAKVGDGINDAPALAAADIGIAMGGGTDIALETADAAVLHGRVKDIPAMLALSQATMGNIWQNITVALGLKAVFLVTTIIGLTGLWPAILADTGATVLVTANAMRLLAWKSR